MVLQRNAHMLLTWYMCPQSPSLAYSSTSACSTHNGERKMVSGRFCKQSMDGHRAWMYLELIPPGHDSSRGCVPSSTPTGCESGKEANILNDDSLIGIVGLSVASGIGKEKTKTVLLSSRPSDVTSSYAGCYKEK